MVDVYKLAHGTMRTSRQPGSKVVGEIVAWISRDTEVRDVEGNRFPHPRVEPRLKIDIRRNGETVAFGEVPLAQLIEGLGILAVSHVEGNPE